jgi:hypothetical protein
MVLGQVTSRISPSLMSRQAINRKMALWKRHFIFVIALWFSTFWAVRVSAERPDFLIVLADDLGYGDLGCYGRKEAHTPSRSIRQGWTVLDSLLRRQCKLLTFVHRVDDWTHTHPRRGKQLDSDALNQRMASSGTICAENPLIGPVDMKACFGSVTTLHTKAKRASIWQR